MVPRQPRETWYAGMARNQAEGPGSVQEVAQDLLDLYARRHIAEGFAFSPDNAWQSELESSFPYVETG